MIGPCGHATRPGDRFCAQCGARLFGLKDLADRAQSGEHRLITVLFCDLIGSTELSSRFDLDDLRGLLTFYHDTCTRIVHEHGGYVAQHLGDGILAYFGYRTAHDDDARRAVAAALEITRVIPGVRYQTSDGAFERLEVRIGIDSGLTVAEQIGYGENRQSLALGETPNVAARLQTLAKRNSVVVSGDTQRLIGADFDLAALEHPPLRGLTRTVTAYEVVTNFRSWPSVLSAPRTDAVPMIGRQSELERILGEFERATAGEQRCILVGGEAGIGKSRLLHAAREALAHRDLRWVAAACLPFYTNTAHYAAQLLLEELAGLVGVSGAEERLARLDAFLHDIDCSDTLAFIASVLGFEGTDTVSSAGLSPEARKKKTFEAYIRIVRAAARARTLVLAVEDVHLADPSTVELLASLNAEPSDTRLLVILTARTPYSGGDVDLSWAMATEPIQLTPLEPEESRELLRVLADSADMPESTVTEILDSSGGIPIYIEELTKNAVEQRAHGAEGDPAESAHAHSGQSSTIPIKVRSSVSSRLDRLGPARAVAQLAATIGNIFDETLIAKLSDRDGVSLRVDLDALVNAGILTRTHGDTPKTTAGEACELPLCGYQFRHAMLREVAYDFLPKSVRREYHSRIAAVLEDDLDGSRQRPEFIAQHWSQARRPEKALPQFVLAARHSSQRYANVEAAAFYTRALQSLRDMLQIGHNVSPEWRQRHSEICESLGDTLALLVRRDEAEASYREAIAYMTRDEPLDLARICRKIGMVWQQEPERALSLYDQAAQHLGPDRADQSREWRQEWVNLQLARVRSYYWFNLSEKMLELVAVVKSYMDDYADALQRSEFFNLLTLTGVRRERYAVSVETLNHARDYVRAASDTADLVEIASSQLTLGVVLFCRGDCEESVSELEQALRLAREAGHPTFEIRGLTYLCSAHRRLGHVDRTLELCAELLRLSTDRHMIEYAGMAHSNLAWAALAQGDQERAEQHARDALRDWDAFQVPYPFQWTARLPLLALSAVRNDLGLACEQARVMLRPEQHALPDALNCELERMVARAEAGDELGTRESLDRAVAAAEMLHLLHLAARSV